MATDKSDIAGVESNLDFLAKNTRVAGGDSQHEFLRKKLKEPDDPTTQQSEPQQSDNDESNTKDTPRDAPTNWQNVTNAEYKERSKIKNIKIGTSADLEDYVFIADIPVGAETYRIWKQKQTWGQAFWTITLSLLIWVLAAFIWQQNKEWPLPLPGGGSFERLSSGWSSGLCEWPNNMLSCFCACCCAPISWADTMDMTGLLQFWLAFGILAAVMLLKQLPLPWIGLPFDIAICIMLTSFRNQLRGIFGMEKNTYTMLSDCCCYCWCFPCTLSQDSRHVELAASLGHEVVLAQRPIIEEDKEEERKRNQLDRNDTAYLEG